MAGVLGILRGFQSDVVARVFGLSNKEAEDLARSQPGGVIVKLRNGIEFPNASNHGNEKLYAAIDTLKADVVVKDGGIINSLTENDFPMLVGMGLSAKFVRLEGEAMLAPSFVADGSVQVIYVAKGSGRIQVGGSDGTPSFDGEVKEGELMVVPQFFGVTEITDEGGMELFMIINTSKPVFEQLAGKVSVWKALLPVVLQSALNISPELEKLCRSKINTTESLLIIPKKC